MADTKKTGAIDEGLRAFLPAYRRKADWSEFSEEEIDKLRRLAERQKNDEDLAEHADPRTTRRIQVASPRVPNAVDIVDAVISPIDAMYRRRQLSLGQWQAANRLREAWEAVIGTTGGAMDFDRVRGAGAPGTPPPEAILIANDILKQARDKLYELDHRIVHMVVFEDRNLGEVADFVLSRKSTTVERRDISVRMRAGLDELAGMWFGAVGKKAAAISKWHLPDADPKSKPYSTEVTETERGRTAHAGRHGLRQRRSKKSR